MQGRMHLFLLHTTYTVHIQTRRFTACTKVSLRQIRSICTFSCWRLLASSAGPFWPLHSSTMYHSTSINSVSTQAYHCTTSRRLPLNKHHAIDRILQWHYQRHILEWFLHILLALPCELLLTETRDVGCNTTAHSATAMPELAGQAAQTHDETRIQRTH